MFRDDLWDELGQKAEGYFGQAEPIITDRTGDEPRVLGGCESFEEFIRRVRPTYRFFRHNRELIKVCQLIADGKLKRVIINVPPGTSKSETVSRLFSAYYLYRYPSREVGLVSYGASLAQDLAGDAREVFIECGGKLDPSTMAKGDWASLSKGGMWGAGFGGPIRGRRFHLGIIDDPHKGPEELESDVLREKVPKWWNNTWLNRQNLWFEEGAAIVVIMQRIHQADLVGWLMEQPDADQWLVVAFDAIKSDEPFDFPEGVAVWPDWRKTGELLCPELLDAKRLAEQQKDPDTFAAQYQQRPKPTSGNIFDVNCFRRCLPEHVPLLFRKVMGVDLAVSTKDGADYTAGFPVGYGWNGAYYIFRPVHGRMETPDARPAIAARARESQVAVLAVERVAFQLSFVQDLKRMPELAGIVVAGVDADMDKEARARGWSPFVASGQVYLVDDGSGWIEKFLPECKDFPRKKKDQVDAVGIAFTALRTLDPGSGALVAGDNRMTGAALLQQTLATPAPKNIV